ncbi:hypothetical protein GCM10023336_15750 [Streptomyces similanensis]|uniref:Uncharacterized protein n=1 Tax=Streptomyces similanensis TaxID=1274988 RepID=A0ABP9K385_9ACTN
MSAPRRFSGAGAATGAPAGPGGAASAGASSWGGAVLADTVNATSSSINSSVKSGHSITRQVQSVQAPHMHVLKDEKIVRHGEAPHLAGAPEGILSGAGPTARSRGRTVQKS